MRWCNEGRAADARACRLCLVSRGIGDIAAGLPRPMRIVSSMTIAQPTPSLVLCRMIAALLRAVRVRGRFAQDVVADVRHMSVRHEPRQRQRPTRTDAIVGSRCATPNQLRPASREPKISPDVAPKYSSSSSPDPVRAKAWRRICR
jgi:hypothetical protein